MPEPSYEVDVGGDAWLGRVDVLWRSARVIVELDSRRHHGGLVARDGAVAFATALWFWMTPQPPKPSAHAALLGRWQPSSADQSAGRKPGFGMTINIINGGLECNRPTDDRVRDRLRFYAHFTELLDTTQGSDVECASMQPY